MKAGLNPTLEKTLTAAEFTTTLLKRPSTNLVDSMRVGVFSLGVLLVAESPRFTTGGGRNF